MKYSVIRTDKFNDQLTDIILYINATFSKNEAIEYLDFLEIQINNLHHIINIKKYFLEFLFNPIIELFAPNGVSHAQTNRLKDSTNAISSVILVVCFTLIIQL